ncbi:MAG TPA: hypothetical protein VIE89_17615, partial [Candidatus Binatia bacterium]
AKMTLDCAYIFTSLFFCQASDHLPMETSFLGSSGFPVKTGFGDCTAETRRTRSKEFLIEKFSDLCELGASVVNGFFTENAE